VWIGAGTRDIGLSLTRLSFQVTHATDSDTNAERDFIVGELRKNRSIEAAKVYQAGENLLTERVNRYITDGKITLAILAAK
jgi:LssY C-terminus